MRRTKIITAVFLALPLATALLTQTGAKPARNVTDPGVVTTRQAITPAGVQSVFDGRVYGVTFGATPNEVWVLAGAKDGGPSLYHMNWHENTVLGRWSTPGS